MLNSDDVLYLHSLDPGQNEYALNFFRTVAVEVAGKTTLQDDLQVIVVVHAFEEVLPFLQAIKEFTTLSGIVMKNSTGTLRPEYGSYLRRQGYNVLELGKDDFRHPSNGEKTIACLNSALRPEIPSTILIDHGGYFAQANGIPSMPKGTLAGLAAVTEYTANGEYRWQDLREKIGHDIPIVSVGTDPIKRSSDRVSAQQIVDGAVYVSYQYSLGLLGANSRIGVIGYGRLGSDIVEILNSRGIAVSVFDTDRSKFECQRPFFDQKNRMGSEEANRQDIIQESTIIFCCTGNSSLRHDDFKHLKPNTVLFTVTSPDDELKLARLVDDGVLSLAKEREGMYGYRIGKTEKIVWLGLNGESPNIIFPTSINSPEMYLPYAAQLAATLDVHRNPTLYSPGVGRTRGATQGLVSRVWTRYFRPTELIS